MSRRRIWSEFVDYRELRSGRALSLLAERSIQLLLAVTPSVQHDVADVIAACSDEGVSLGLWPLLEDAQGRWANESNVEAFRIYLLRILDRVGPRVGPPLEIVFDLEPAIEEMQRALRSPRSWARALPRRERHDGATLAFEGLAREVRSRDMVPIAAVTPLVLVGAARRPSLWERLLGTPVDGVGFDAVHVMLYTSMLEGYTKGRVRRQDALWWLSELSCRARARWGARAGVSLGVAGRGALGDEPPYRSTSELAEDVAVAAGTGVADLALFNLRGVLEREPVHAWLDALVCTEGARQPPKPTRRARALLGAADLATAALGGVTALSDRLAG